MAHFSGGHPPLRNLKTLDPLTVPPNKYDNEINVRQCKGCSLVVPVKIENSSTLAVVDTAAMVTLISTAFFQSLAHRPEVVETVSLKGLGPQPVYAQKIRDLNIQLGSRKYSTEVYVADMPDAVLLGLDFLSRHGCTVDLKENTVSIYGETLSAILKRNTSDEDIHVSRVTLPKSRTFPPNSVTLVQVSLDNPPFEHKGLVIDPVRKPVGTNFFT